MIASLQSIAIDQLLVELARGARPPFSFGFCDALPEHFIEIILATALSKRALCDGVLSGVLRPSLTGQTKACLCLLSTFFCSVMLIMTLLRSSPFTLNDWWGVWRRGSAGPFDAEAP